MSNDIIHSSRTDVGRVRTNNEDNFLIDAALGLYIVADGMGGHNAGEVASEQACAFVKNHIVAAAEQQAKYVASGKSSDLKALRKLLESAVSKACKEIFDQASANPEQSGMGCTFTMMWLVGHKKGIMAHVGDSRLYVIRGTNAHQLSEDHTFVNELLKRGAINKEQAKNHPQGNVLSRALGVAPSTSVDTMIFDVDPGDTYLICSDGLYNYFPDAREIGAALAVADLEGALNQLVDTALQRGGHDNTTGICVRIASGDGAATGIAAEKRIALLKRIPIFAHLTYHELVKVVGLTQLSNVGAGQPIITEGERGAELYVVLVGEVDIIKGGNFIVTLKAGAHLGEMAMIDNAPRSATVQAKTDVNLLVMRREEFFSLLRCEPVIATKLLWSFVQVLSGRLRETNDQLQGAKEELEDQDDSFEIFIDDDDIDF